MDTGNDDITIDLLNDKYHNAEDDGVGRLAYEQDQRAGNGADEGTEDGDDIGDADDNADQRCIGHTCDLDEQEADKTNQHGVEDGCNKIFTEGSVCQRQEIRDFVVKFFTAERFCKLFRLCNDIFFCAEKIGSKHKAEHDVKEHTRYGLQNVLQLRQIFLQQRVKVCDEIVYISHCRIYDSRDEAVALRELFDKCF